MPASRTVLSAALAATLALCAGACSRNAGDTVTNAAAPQAPAEPAADTVSPAADPGVAGTTATDGEGTAAIPAPCNADAVQALVGQAATDAVLEQAKADSGARAIRALKPGQPATMDFRADRLDIALDEDNIIQSLRCG